MVRRGGLTSGWAADEQISITPGRTKDGALPALKSSPDWISPGPLVQPAVLPVCCNTGCDWVWPANQLKPGWDLAVFQGGMVAAVAADELEYVAVAIFWLALYDSGRLAPQDQSPVVPGLTAGCHACLLAMAGPLACGCDDGSCHRSSSSSSAASTS
jgi:hypothetical protein